MASVTTLDIAKRLTSYGIDPWGVDNPMGGYGFRNIDYAAALLLILGLAGPAMAHEQRSAPVTNFGMGAQSLPWANEPLSEQENLILFNKMMRGELSPAERWLYEQRVRNSPQPADMEPVPHRYSEEDPAELRAFLRRKMPR